MRKPHIVFIIITVFHAFFLFSESDYATSVVPGWHTSIIPPVLLDPISTTIILLFVDIAYWILITKSRKVSWAFFTLHFTLTVGPLLFIRFPFYFISAEDMSMTELDRVSGRLIPYAGWIFILGQLIFTLYFSMAMIRARRKAMSIN